MPKPWYSLLLIHNLVTSHKHYHLHLAHKATENSIYYTQQFIVHCNVSIDLVQCDNKQIMAEFMTCLTMTSAQLGYVIDTI